ncbi:MAG TPA: bacillithiol biosynthesis cysteine-adding enzyme BshC [Gaiellaceae bacterium]
MSESIPTAQVATARESNAAAARRGLWDALATTECGRPEVVSRFFELLPPDRDIVDVGCWNGAIAALGAASVEGGAGRDDPAAAPWRSYLGVDLVAEAVSEFRRAHRARPRTRAVEGDVRALPLPDGSADVVLCLFVLQDLRDRADGMAALGELARIVRPGGELLIGLTVHSNREEETFYVVKKLRREGIPEKPTHHWRHADFLEALRLCGLRATGIDEFGPTERGFVELYVRALKGRRASSPGKRTIPVGLVPGMPKLSVDYVADFGRVQDLFAHDFRDPDAFRRAADTAVARDLPRNEVADVLADQSRRFRSRQASVRNIERLREPGSVAVVTGQQPALFGGPLYNLYKALTAVRLAQVLEQRNGRPHVPVFWIANDDHSLESVDHVHVLGGSGEIERIAWEHSLPRMVQPIAVVELDDGVTEAVDRLAESAAGASACGDVLALVSDCFRAGERLSDSFARLLGSLFERDGLVLVDPSEPKLRRLGMPMLAAELGFPSPATEAAREATTEVAARGYPVQVPLRDDRLNLFFGRSERFRLRCGAEGFQITHTSGRVDAEALRSSFHAAPEQFSPNVLLRPLYQDALFPTAAYVAGPSEIAYFAQLKPVYARFGIPMPVVHPRLSATLVSSRASALLARTGLGVEDVWAGRGESSWLRSSLLPNGQPQERVLGLVHALLENGLELVPQLGSRMSPFEFDHQVVAAGSGAGA